ncbi:ABM domain-containing protein [Pleurotus pulmonarius]
MSTGSYVALPIAESPSPSVTTFLSAFGSVVIQKANSGVAFRISPSKWGILTQAVTASVITEAFLATSQKLEGGPIYTDAQGPPKLETVAFLASKLTATKQDENPLVCGLEVRFRAKEGKEEDVRQFLKGAVPLVEAEPDTLLWYAIEFPESPREFGIIDAFPSEAGRRAHLDGKVAAALFGPGKELLEGDPSVQMFDVLGGKM